MAEMVEKLKIKPSPDYKAGAGDVPCDVCTGRKYKAVKSCLECQESYCHSHLERHEEFHSRKRHRMIEATDGLQEMICSKHQKLLEVFCRTDQQCVCVWCVMDEHKNHDTVSAAAQRTETQKQLIKAQLKFQQKIQQREEDLQQLRDSVESHKRSALQAVEDTEKIFTEMIQSIQRRCDEVKQQIRDQEKTSVSEAEGIMEKLQQEINDLKRKDKNIERLLQTFTEDDISFIQSFPSLSASPESVDVSFTCFFSFDDVTQSVHQLRNKLQELCSVMKKIPDGVTDNNIDLWSRRNFLRYSRQFTLDQNTMNNRLLLSERNTVTHTDTVQSYPDHPDRFDGYYQVLCEESVSGRCYWELEWTGDTGVWVSVSYKSISRKEQVNESCFGFNNQSWSLCCSFSEFTFIHKQVTTDLPVSSSISRRVGVFVDHDAGTLSFYSVSDTMTLIHRVQTTFTQPLCPGVYVGSSSSVTLCDMSK